jgi:hypothetical protein
MTRFAILLLLAFASPAAAEAGDWVCQKTYRFGEDRFWVNRILGPDGALKERSVRWRARRGHDGAELGWAIPAAGPWHARPDGASLDMLLARVPREAVSTRLKADGRIVDLREQLSRRQARRHSRRSGLVLGASFLPPQPIPRLHGVRELRMEAVGADGRILAWTLLPLPQWKEVDRLAEQALRELETLSADYRSNCLEQTGPEI